MLPMTTGGPLYVQPDRHDEVDEAALVPRLDQSRSQRADQLEDEILGLRALETVAEELRVEADLERLAVERDGQRLARLADVRGLRGHLQRALAEFHPQRRVLLGEQANAPHDLAHLGSVQVQLVLERVRQQLLVVREAPFHKPRREGHLADAEDHLVLESGYLDLVAALARRDPRQLLQRAGGHVRLEAAVERLVERR